MAGACNVIPYLIDVHSCYRIFSRIHGLRGDISDLLPENNDEEIVDRLWVQEHRLRHVFVIYVRTQADVMVVADFRRSYHCRFLGLVRFSSFRIADDEREAMVLTARESGFTILEFAVLDPNIPMEVPAAIPAGVVNPAGNNNAEFVPAAINNAEVNHAAINNAEAVPAAIHNGVVNPAGNNQVPELVIGGGQNQNGAHMRMRLLYINSGEDIRARIEEFSVRDEAGEFSIISATGSVSRLSIFLRTRVGDVMSEVIEGCFQIISLTGVMVPDRERGNGLSTADLFVSLQSSGFGQTVSGRVADTLVAGSAVRVVIGSR